MARQYCKGFTGIEMLVAVALLAIAVGAICLSPVKTPEPPVQVCI